MDDDPDYGGFLRGRIVTVRGRQLVVVYCRPTALAAPGPPLTQFMRGLNAVPVPLATHALVISDNADLYGTLADLTNRAAGAILATAGDPWIRSGETATPVTGKVS